MAFEFAWAGGEDLFFQKGGLPYVDTTSGRFLTDLGQRCSLQAPSGGGNPTKGEVWYTGDLTSAMMSWRGYIGGGLYGVTVPMGGVGESGTLNSLIVGAKDGTLKSALYTFDGTTLTELAAEAGTALFLGQLQKIDLQVLNYGTDATVNVWVDGVLVITFTGNVTVGDMASFDICVFGVTSGATYYYFSEVIVGAGTSDSRALRLGTQAGNEEGDTDEWSGDYTDWNPVALDDDNSVYTATAGQDEQAKVNGLTGVWNVLGCQLGARSSMTDGSPVTTEKLGWKTNGTVNVDAGQSLSTDWDCYQRFSQINPVTGNPWQWSEINALQIELQSAA